MSLLLDALKKAADDKSKKVPPEKQNITQSVELDLDLKSDEPDSYLQVNDEAIIKHTLQTNPTKDDTKFDISEKLYSIDPQANELKHTSENEKELSLESIDTELDADAIDSSTTNSASATHAYNNETPPKANARSTQQPVKSSTSQIKTEQALSALINKSNQHSRHEKLKKNISLAILITLILIISGVYFYIDMQSTSQHFNLAGIDNTSNKTTYQKPISPTPSLKANSDTHSPLISDSATTKSIGTVKASIKPKPVKKSIIKEPLNHSTQPVKTFNITRTQKADPIHLLISEAYDAFHSANYRQSEKLYKQALNREPKNRDALLGLAAIGIKEKRYEYSRQKYQYLLRLNPTDSYAISGLSGIERHVDAQLSESQLKFMLKQQPDAAHLYFALGSQYSSQLKWAEAQSAYFSAWSADNKNADYCYNLAVSLDHLGKTKQALNFYKLSLKLKQASGSNFLQADTEQRIQSLQANAQ